MEEIQLRGALEAILFAVGKAVEVEKLAEAIGCDRGQTEQLLAQLAEQYESGRRGIRLKRLEDSYQLCTGEEYYDCLMRIVSHPPKNALTDAQMEVLAIVAYKQPVTKAQIDRIRGVKSDHAVNRLLEWNLIEEAGRLNAPGHPILFATSRQFLQRFGISSPAELPPISKQQLEHWEEDVWREVQGQRKE